jgi:AcrR family transcriptional regulator
MKKLSRRERERIAREKEIVDAAVKLFLKQGFENTSMDEIAKESEFTKRTVYQYFLNKEDLFFAVVLQGFRIVDRHIKKAGKKGRNGAEQLTIAINDYYSFSKEHSELFVLMNYVNFVGRADEKEPSPYKKKWFAVMETIFSEVVAMIRRGKEDGSMRKNLDEGMTAYAMVFLFSGFFLTFLTAGKLFSDKFNLDSKEFARFIIDLLTDSVKIPAISFVDPS